ncbi:penicillin acylase family protein [Steroidobacter sp.]|uniref:penicillin acylase family protein n=1 Tax=Steroidobacter sp. TaxID=1978227 RepID=UPI0025E654E8|nr:penicillin acylase family protein [Steroidobacter sp.]
MLRIFLICLCFLTIQAAPAADTATEQGEIRWDRYGIPHIYGRTVEDACFGLGYAQMTNHAEQLLINVAAARGRYAEYFGAGPKDKFVTSDVFIRTMGSQRRAQQWLTQGGDEQRRYLRAFVDGVNAYAKDHKDTIPTDMRAVLPLTETDPLVVWQWTMQFGFQALGPMMIKRQWEAAADQGEPRRAASNAWAIAPSKSAAGTTMLMGNPHLDFGVNGVLSTDRETDPDRGVWQWMQAHVVIGDPERPSVNLTGVGFLGLPAISIGFNDRIAWTHTDNRAQTASLYELSLSGESYRWAGGTKPLVTQTDTVRVCNKAPECEDRAFSISHSVHGPVVTRKGNKALALRVTGLDAPSPFAQYWDMGRARNFQQFESAFSRLQMPFFYVIYADADGRIMIADGGRRPVRNGGTYEDYDRILPGDDPKQIWKGIVPWRALPKVIDPPSGFVQNANDSPWTTTFPPVLRQQDFPAWLSFDRMWPRSEVSARMLLSQPKFSYDDLVRAKFSTRMLMADRLLPELLAGVDAQAQPDEPTLAAVKVLREWDRTSDRNSRGSVLFLKWWQEYTKRMANSPRAGSVREPKFREQYDPSRPLETPTGIEDLAQALAALPDAAKIVVATYGALDVSWGEANRVVLVSRDANFTHPKPIADVPANGSEDSVGIIAKMNYLPEDERGRRIAVGGEGYVQIVEFTPQGPRAGTLLVYGNASRPGSPHIADQLPAYVDKRLLPALLSRAEVEKQTTRREVLRR